MKLKVVFLAILLFALVFARQGSFTTGLTNQSADYSGGTDWTSGSSTPLPPNIKTIYVGITPGTTCNLKIDGGGATGVIFYNLQQGWVPLPLACNITRIYSPANGSTGAQNLVVAN